MKLIEITDYPTYPERAVQHWLNDVCTGEWTVNPDGSIYVDGDVLLHSRQETMQLPVQFADVTGTFRCAYTDLTTLKGAPRGCNKLDAEGCKNLAPDLVNYLPVRAFDQIRITGTTHTYSLHGIHKRVKFCNSFQLSNCTHFLGCLLVNGLTNIHIKGLHSNVNIMMNTYLSQPKEKQDINLFQEQLIDAGFGQYARL